MTITDRIDAVTLIPDEARRVDPPAPRSAKLELTGKCNLRCGFCALRLREEQPKVSMTWDLFVRVATECRDAGVEELGMFYLGEPFMEPLLLERAIEYAKAGLGFPYVFVTSNATLATPERVEACMAAGLDSLKWSVNASDPEQYSEIMGVKPGLFFDALRNIEAAHTIREQHGYSTALYASSIQYDGNQAARMQALLDERVAPFVDAPPYLLPLYSMGALTTEREAELGYRPIAGNQGRVGAMRDPLPCWSAFTEAHVTHPGLVSACCFDADERWIMGDLSRQSFFEAWHSDAFRELRAAHLQRDVTGTICEQCVAYQ